MNAHGVLLGTALGDALGLPYEGLSPSRAGRLLPGPLRPRLVGSRMMVSDDTEHTILTAQALLAAPDDVSAFARDLGWRLRGWLLALPAGVGFATLRACLKLCAGVSPERAGVRSAGNGPAMRAAILGVCLTDRRDDLRAYVRASTRLTHTDPRAERGALAVALVASGVPVPALPEIMDMDDELLEALDRPQASSGPNGVKGYIYDTVGAALAAYRNHPGDWSGVVSEAVAAGGDTDTVAAIAGGLAGARGDALPDAWLQALWEWPRDVSWMASLAGRLEATFQKGERPGPLPVAWPLIPLRNALFLGTVLAHGFRRLAPPY
ncbi:MAG TPA: ADP-ribosylglycohydrolase family protein [Candidatus Xenobia bacterium]|jgi:ADP-ribosylglycohydrolase